LDPVGLGTHFPVPPPPDPPGAPPAPVTPPPPYPPPVDVIVEKIESDPLLPGVRLDGEVAPPAPIVTGVGDAVPINKAVPPGKDVL
jgi:hypothetical protein